MSKVFPGSADTLDMERDTYTELAQETLCDLCDSPRAFYSVNMLTVCSECVLEAVDCPEIVLKCGDDFADTEQEGENEHANA